MQRAAPSGSKQKRRPNLIFYIILVALIGGIVYGGYCTVTNLTGDDTKSSSPDSTVQPNNSTTVQPGGNTPTATRTATSGGSQPTPTPNRNTFPTIQVGLVSFGSYLSAVGALSFADARGVKIELVDLGGKEAIQCDWVAGRLTNNNEFPPAPSGVTRMLFTTQNSARVCDGVKIVTIIDQSAGADTILVRPEVTNFNQLFKAPVIMAGECSVSEYFYRTVAWAFGVTDGSNLRLAPGPDEAGDLLVPDTGIKAIVTYEPSASRVVAKVPTLKPLLTTANWPGILDVAVVKADSATNEATKRFLGAWYEFLRLESENFDAAWKVLDDYHKAHSEDPFVGGYAKEDLRDELTNLIAQASFQDNVNLLIQDTSVVEARLKEVDNVQNEFPCTRQGQVPRPSSFSPKEMIDARYIQALQSDAKIQTGVKPLSKKRVTLSTTIPLIEATAGEGEKLIGDLTSVYLEFKPDSAEFTNDAVAREILERNFASVLRLTDNTVLELVGGYAKPLGCINCDAQSGAVTALARANRVKDLLVKDLKIDPARIRVSQTVRQPAYPDTPNSALQRQDRRVEGKLLVVGGQ